MTESDPILEGLNPVQREAVLHGDGPLLVLAGAGSGKTRVLTRRAAHIILRRNVPPDRLLAVTFTNKAAGEMRERVERLLGFEASGLWIGTFHSICLRLLRRHSDRLGFSGPVTVFDDDDQSSLLREILKGEGQDDEAPKVRELKTIISSAKNKLWSPDELAASWPHPKAERVAGLYAEYQKRLRAQGGVDFDDLLVLAVQLLENDEEIGSAYARKFLHLLVDEYQDTNHVQFRLVRRLAATHQNVMVVGDDDQSIYGWRGADISNILDFERHFPGARALAMTQNYRSTRAILAVAHAVVSRNEGRREKELWTENPEGDPIVLRLARDEEEEAKAVIGEIRDGLRDRRWRETQVAILYRVHAQSRPLEEACLTLGVPYAIVGGVAFYARREVRDLVAYLRLVVNPRDEASFRRALLAPRRGIGDGGLEKILAAGNRAGGDLVRASATLEPGAGVREAARKKAVEFGQLLLELAERSAEGPEPLLSRLIERIDYMQWLRDSSDGDFEDRRANVEELLEGAARFQAARGDDDSLTAYLDQIALYTNLDQRDAAGERITLMTVHNAKGLEFPVVFIAGIEEGLFPHASSYDDPAELEEERRLFYVAATRAMRELHLSAAMERRRMNWSAQQGPSRFLEELPADRVVERPLAGRWASLDPLRGAPGRFDGGAARRPSGVGDRSWEQGGGYAERSRRTTAAPDDVDDLPFEDLPSRTSSIREAPSLAGRTVRHAVFGQGVVEEADGVGPEARLTVRFAGAGRKKLIARFVTPLA